MMTRRLEPEWMDAADVDPAEHRRALAGLRRINRVSRTAQDVAGPIRAICRARGLTHVRLLDVASGGGDVPLDVACRLKACGVRVELTLADQSAVGLQPAVERAKKLGIEARAWVGDVVQGLPGPPYDAVTCSLFLHHLDFVSTARVLANMKASCHGILVVSDLLRSRAGLIAAVAGCHVLSRSRLVHHDGPASVRAAWRVEELDERARHAELDGVRIERRFPWRMRLVWRAR